MRRVSEPHPYPLAKPRVKLAELENSEQLWQAGPPAVQSRVRWVRDWARSQAH